MSVTRLILGAFNLAKARYPEVYKSWIAISGRLGGLLPDSLLIASVQRAGDLDMVVRAMEDERQSAAHEFNDDECFAADYQKALSELWIGQVYEILRLLKARKLASGDAFHRLAHDFRLLRIPLEKHEIVEDPKLTAPLPMQAYPVDDSNPGLRVYNKDDPQRGYVMPSGLSNRGSVIWLVLDHRAHQQFWLERRELSERMIALWQPASDRC
jgi:hypothetical protein